MSAPRLVLVAAVADNGVIGSEGKLPWRLSADMRLFRTLTLGKPVVMGRRTYESLGRPLPGRDNIVISRTPGFAPAGVTVAPDLATALDCARDLAGARGAEEIAVIGGARVYAETMAGADRIYLSRVHATPAGDTWFPPLDPAEWREVSRQDYPAGPGDTADFTFVVLEREPPSRASP